MAGHTIGPMTGTARTASTPGPKPLLGDMPSDRLYEAALACFDRRGFRKTSMDDIAQEAGVSRPTIYTYFRSKKDVVLEVIVRQAAVLLAGVEERVSGRQGLDRVIEAAYLGIQASNDNPYFRAFIAGGGATAWIAEILAHERFQAVERGFWRPTIQQAIDADELRDDRDIDEIIDWIIFQQFALATHGEALGLSQADIRQRLHTYLAAALRPVSHDEAPPERGFSSSG